MTAMGDSPSDAVLAARRRFEETSGTAAARMGASAQASVAANEQANAANKQFTENIQKVERRVRELIDERAAKRDWPHDNEIQVGGQDEEEPDEVAAEFKDLIENFPIAEPAEAAPDAAETTGPVPSVDAPPPDPRWQVQAGRFGRRPQSAPPAEPAPPAPPKPAPRRAQPVFDDEDDFENQTWLR